MRTVPSPCPLEGEPEMLASQQREVSTATCRLQFASGEVWTGPQRILRDPQFLCTMLFPAASRHKQFQRCKSSAAPWTGFGPRFPCPAPFHLPSLPEIQRRPRPSPNTRSLTNSRVAYILGIFFDSRAVSASRPTEKK